MRSRVPVIVLSGYLGSGKTTVLNHLLRTSGARIGVVVNDFGATNVDALLVRGSVDTTAISGGCLCCLSDTTELDDALRRLARLDLDAVVVEASGLAEPRELARMVLASDVRGIRFGGLVEVLDAARWTTEDPPVAVDHLRVASLLVVNKSDRAHRPRARLDELLSRVSPGTPVVHVVHGQVDPALLLDAAERPEPSGQLSLADLLAGEPHDHHEHHEHEAFASVELDADADLHPARLVDLVDHPSPGTYRVKGVVRVAGRRGGVVVHGVGDWFALERDDRPDRSQLVVIGTGLDEDQVRSRLDALAVTEDELPSDADRYAVERHLRR